MGVLLNLDGTDGAVELGHTEGRKEELRELLEMVLSDGHVLTKTGESLRGRLQWFETFALGRTVNLCLHRVGEISMCSGRSHRITSEDIAVLSFPKNRVLTAPPMCSRMLVGNVVHLHRWILRKSGQVWWIWRGTHGYQWQTHVSFSRAFPAGVMEVLLGRSDNPIYELELAPILIAIGQWGSRAFEILRW